MKEIMLTQGKLLHFGSNGRGYRVSAVVKPKRSSDVALRNVGMRT